MPIRKLEASQPKAQSAGRTHRALQTVSISNGVVTRKYSLQGDQFVCVAYHTPSQSVVFLEGDSAEVWWRLYVCNGGCESALHYIMEHGTFLDRETEARVVLSQFLDDLESSSLIGQKG